MRFPLLVVLVLLGFPALAEDCLKDGGQIALEGVLWRETFPGPPNYRSIDDGDAPETVWVLTIDSPRCFMAEDMENGRLHEVGRVSRFQLVLNERKYKENKGLLERRVSVTGQIVQAASGHHHTKALIEVKELKASPPKR